MSFIRSPHTSRTHHQVKNHMTISDSAPVKDMQVECQVNIIYRRIMSESVPCILVDSVTKYIDDMKLL
jgi:hypothetical protein